jgi:hypothetical protein
MRTARSGYGRNRWHRRWRQVVQGGVKRFFSKRAAKGSVRELVDKGQFFAAYKRLNEHGGPKRDIDYLVKAQVKAGLLGAAQKTVNLGASPEGIDCLLKAQHKRGLVSAVERTVNLGASPQGLECLVKAKVKSGSLSSAESLLERGASPEGVDSAVKGWVKLGRYRKARDVAQKFGASEKVVKLLERPQVSLTVRKTEVPTVNPPKRPKRPKVPKF